MGWIGSLFTFVGLVLNAKRYRASWLVWLMGNVFWIIHALKTDDASLLCFNIVFLWVNVYGYRTWKRETPL